MKVSEIITELNKLGGKHGIGIVDIVENRVVGMKSRGVYETPGGTILMEAHDQLEELVLDRATYEVKKDMGNKMAQIVYEGKWFTPLREAVQAFVDVTQQYVTGEVKFKLYKGNIIKAGTTSPYSLYSESLASFTTGELYDHHDAEGFINLFGLPLKVRAMKMQELENKINKRWRKLIHELSPSFIWKQLFILPLCHLSVLIDPVQRTEVPSAFLSHRQVPFRKAGSRQILRKFRTILSQRSRMSLPYFWNGRNPPALLPEYGYRKFRSFRKAGTKFHR